MIVIHGSILHNGKKNSSSELQKKSKKKKKKKSNQFKCSKKIRSEDKNRPEMHEIGKYSHLHCSIKTPKG